MTFGINPPWYQDPIEYTAFNAHIYHQQQIENFINILSHLDDPNDVSNQNAAAWTADLNLDSLTEDEVKYIEKEVSRKWM